MLAKRLTQIMETLNREGMMTVANLSRQCGVTEKTIRLDLDKLEKMNMVVRVHGGAILSGNNSDIYPAPSRKQKHIGEKTAIARAALELIEDGDTIFLDAGSTGLELARLLNKNVIVITNDAMIAAELLSHTSVTLYCTGGLLQRSEASTIYVGPDTVNLISRYRTSKCFMGCSALNLTYGLMVFSSIEAEIKAEIIRASEKVICLADNSKFGRTAFTSYLGLEDVDICVTDSLTSEEDCAKLRQNGVEVVVGRVES